MIEVFLGNTGTVYDAELYTQTRQGAEPHAKDVHPPGAVLMSLVEEGQGYTGGH